MKMSDYISETTFAAARLMEGVWHEREELNRIRTELAPLTEATVRGYEHSIALADDDFDDRMSGTGASWETYFGVDRDRFQKEAEHVALTAIADTNAFSIASLSGALLQVAQQGIAVVHRGAGPIAGRSIGTQNLRTVIWEARNQAMHWEDTRGLLPKAETCFQTLAADVGGKFNEYNNRSLAFDVVELLDWRSVDRFAADLASLG